MNKTKIEWCDFTWNPVTGCRGGCWYCYARRMYHRFDKSFDPKFHPDRLNEPLRKREPSRIFTGSVTDFWGSGVKQAWRDKVWDITQSAPRHTYLILTKKPELIGRKDAGLLRLLDNVWVGATITQPSELGRWASLVKREIMNPYISFEPVEIRFMPKAFQAVFDRWGKPRWAVVGALTGADRELVRWSQEMARSLACSLIGITGKLFVKDNVKLGRKIRELPDFNREGI